MPKRPAAPKEPTDQPLEERRSAFARKGSGNQLKKLKGALGRPVTLQWRDGQPHVALVERRRTPFLDRAQAHLCDELRARLLALEARETSKLLRNLVAVHDAMRSRGWDGVARLSATVLSKAAMQAEMLAGEDESPEMTELAVELRKLHAAAAAREEAIAPAAAPEDNDALDSGKVEVREASFNEFEELERSWVRTMPSDLAPLSAEG
jgi:hypothetical protein